MWKEITPKECTGNVFKLIGEDWMLIAAGTEEKANAMTASWGGMGVMWGKDIAYVVIRPQRYTKEFIDGQERFSLNFFAEDYRKALSYMGSVSGRDEDKMEKSGLTTVFQDSVPLFEESRLVMVCKKMFVQDMKEEGFLQKETLEKWYPQKDYHTMYLAEIEKIYVK